MSSQAESQSAEINDAALLDARRRASGASNQLLDKIIEGSNCEKGSRGGQWVASY